MGHSSSSSFQYEGGEDKDNEAGNDDEEPGQEEPNAEEMNEHDEHEDQAEEERLQIPGAG